MKRPKKRRRAGTRQKTPRSHMREIGKGEYCYFRQERTGGCTVFRFRTLAETEAATRKGIELDHILGAPPEVVSAILEAADEVRKGLNN